jgi:uncharacterized membrane protein required for colicin V production
MNWVDLVSVILLIAGAIIGSMRGFGRALFDAIGLVLTAKLASVLYPTLADRISFSGDPHVNQAWCLAVLFVVIGAGAIVVGYFIQNSLLISLDSFDPILGAILGLPAAGALVYTLIGILIVGAGGPNAPAAGVYTQSWAAYNFYYFNSYHSMIHTFRNIGGAPADTPN